MNKPNKPIGGNKRRVRKVDYGFTPEQVAHLPALHPARIGANLPTSQAENMVAEKMSNLCDSTKRRGAGEIKPGLPLIKPSGEKAFSEFHELFTKEKEKKEEKKQKSWRDIEREFKKPDGPEYKTVAFSPKFCIWHMEGGQDPANMESGMLPVNERIPRCDMRPGDVFLYFICKPCVDARNEEYKTKIQIPVQGQMVPLSSIKSMEHYNKLRSNIVKVLKSRQPEHFAGNEEGIRIQGLGI